MASVLVLDALGFVAWSVSGQQPADNFYIGAITTNILKAIIY